MTARLAAYQRGQCAATSASVASGPRSRAAIAHRVSPRWTTTPCGAGRPPAGATRVGATTRRTVGRLGRNPGSGACVDWATAGTAGSAVTAGTVADGAGEGALWVGWRVAVQVAEGAAEDTAGCGAKPGSGAVATTPGRAPEPVVSATAVVGIAAVTTVEPSTSAATRVATAGVNRCAERVAQRPIAPGRTASASSKTPMANQTRSTRAAATRSRVRTSATPAGPGAATAAHRAAAT